MPTNLIEIDENLLKSMKSLSLLCVEDDSATREVYHELFSEFFDNIILAEDGEDGYQKYITNDIDLIITDYDMPNLNGLGMTRKIKAINKDVPVILITAIIDTDVIIEALELNVNNFIQKPIKLNKVIDTIESVGKLILANKYFKEQEYKKLKKQEAKEEYNNYQEDLAFAKELNVLRNDFYYQLVNSHCNALVDFSYQPLDILSGDAYSTRKIDDEQTFYLIVDGMGKGLSASLTSMLMTSFINYNIDTQLKTDNFDFHKLVDESLNYIKPILLDEESLSIDYIILNCKNSTMQYAKFAMPVALMQTKEDEIIRVKSNNPPISKYIESFQISSFDISNIFKFLFYSDGMVENPTRFDDKLYMDYVEEDFLDSFTKENMREKLNWKITKAEDDITFIFINKLDLETTIVFEKNFATTLEDVDNASDWYGD
ncbi:MAG: response regulator, partial [Epsilonproteobacteria bacterium]